MNAGHVDHVEEAGVALWQGAHTVEVPMGHARVTPALSAHHTGNEPGEPTPSLWKDMGINISEGTIALLSLLDA